MVGIITHINNVDAQTLGFTPGEMIGCSGYDYIYTNDKFYVSQKHLETFISKIPISIVFRRLQKNQIYVPVLSGAIINETLNEIIVYEKIINFDDDNNANFIVDLDGTISYMNDIYTKLYGYILDDCVKDYELWHPDSLSYFNQKSIALHEKKSCTIKYRKKCKGGNYVHVTSHAIHKGNFIMISEKLA